MSWEAILKSKAWLFLLFLSFQYIFNYSQQKLIYVLSFFSHLNNNTTNSNNSKHK